MPEGGVTLTLELAPSDTTKKVKLMIQDKTGIPPDQQRLVFGGCQLDDGRTLQESSVNEGANLELGLRMCGGGGGGGGLEVRHSPVVLYCSLQELAFRLFCAGRPDDQLSWHCRAVGIRVPRRTGYV